MIKTEETCNKCPLCGAEMQPVLDRNKGTIDCPKCRKSLWFRSKDSRNAPGHEEEEHDRTITWFRVLEKPGKNAKCPCGSGRAYVRCCGRAKK